MRGYPTTFAALFGESGPGRPEIVAIEIPIIQRDYAQGRPDDETTTIRGRFLDALVHAITSSEDLGLDFVYGDVRNRVFRPLDGQQRLTTLFLLHWYVASVSERLDPKAAWLRLSYATRPSARDFTRALALHPYPRAVAAPSVWITDQPWYVYPWRQDPTIASMLVMLDAIHARLEHRTDFDAIWRRMTQPPADGSAGAIWFLLLPVVDSEIGEDLYVTMNSRGKPLTTFEVFKADFESIIKSADPERHKHLIDSIDGSWADVLWEYEKESGGDFIIDDEFERYLTFVIEISEWRDSAPDRKWHDKASNRLWPIEERARLAFADPDNDNAARNRDFFFHAFDTWVGAHPGDELRKLFTAAGVGTGPIPLFSGTPDLFGACIAKYGSEFSAQETLLLFGVLLARQVGDAIAPDEVARRLRSLRNVTAAFLDRDRYMSSYVTSTETLILDGSLDGLEGFRADWVTDEALKWSFLEQQPECAAALHQLEDDSLLRGRIMAFALDSTHIAARARAFTQISPASLRDPLGAALLTKGDYSRDVGWKGHRRQLGSSAKDDSWTDMLTTGSRASLAGIRDPLTMLLDDISARSASLGASPEESLETIRAEWVADRESRRFYDWRYYLARYAGARSSKGEGYYDGHYDQPSGGYRYRQFRLLHGSSYNAYFSDALLRAAWVDGGLASDAEEPSWWHRADPGLTLRKSRIQIRCDDDALEIVVPDPTETNQAMVRGVLADFEVDDRLRVRVQQQSTEGFPIDAQDRVQLSVRLVKTLVAAGL